MKSESKPEETALFGVVVFLLPAAAFTNIYVPQPVLPQIGLEYGIDAGTASLSVSLVILGVTLSNLLFGMLADRFAARPIIGAGGIVVSVAAVLCRYVDDFTWFIILRFFQGLFLPALTTCVAALISRSLPPNRLNVAMGVYVSATVAGGLGGRLVGGWLNPPEAWRNSFFTVGLLLLAATAAAVLWLPREPATGGRRREAVGFKTLLSRAELLRVYAVPFGAFFVFSSVFNYLPFYLSGPDFSADTKEITSIYLAYLMGILIGPLSGRFSNRFGGGTTMAAGAVVMGVAVLFTLIPDYYGVAVCMFLFCTGYFAVHSAAAGALNRKVTAGRGRANALYVLFYYLGGYAGITVSGLCFGTAGWRGVVFLGVCVLSVPVTAGLFEMHYERLKSQPVKRPK